VLIAAGTYGGSCDNRCPGKVSLDSGSVCHVLHVLRIGPAKCFLYAKTEIPGWKLAVDGVRKPRFAVIFMMIFAAFLSLGLPAQDVLDAVYDEVEPVPFEVTPLFSVAAVRPAVVPIIQARLSSFHLKLSAPSPFPTARVQNTDANRSADPRALSALLCILLC